MKKIIVLFCLLAENLLVSGNLLTQVIPTLQTCPNACNQNNYQNPNTYQNPINFQIPNNYQQQQQNSLNIPVLLQQQNQPQQLPIIQQTAPTSFQQPIQTNNNQLCPQQLMLQNQLSAPIPTNQITNPIANQLSQIYMNKILSNPTIQALLDQNGNYLYQTGQEYPQQINTIPQQVNTIPQQVNRIPQQVNTIPQQANTIPQPAQSPVNPPTIVNNYFMLPPDLLKLEKEHDKPPTNPNEPKRRKGSKRRSEDNFDGKRSPNHDVEIGHSDIKRKPIINPDCPIHSRKESYRRPELLEDEEVHTHSTEEKEIPYERRKQNMRNHGKEREMYIPAAHPQQHHYLHPHPHPEGYNADMARHYKRPRNYEMTPYHEVPQHHEMPRHHEMSPHHEVPQHHEKPRPHQPEKKRPNIIIKIKEVPKHVISESVLPIVDNQEKFTEPNSVKRIRQSRDEEIIKDFTEKFPAIPEEVVRKLLSYLRRQIQKQQLGDAPNHHPEVSFPLRYDQLFPNSFVYDLYDRSGRRRRPNRRPNKKQNKTKSNSNSNIETTTNIDLASTVPTTTEKSFIIDNAKEITSKQEFETTTNSVYPELGTEDTISDIGNGIIEDYYPDFTQDRTYFESGEPFSVRSLRDNRYHYTTDRNFETKHHHYKNDKYEESGAVLSKPFDTKIETTSAKYEVETEVQFRTPPSLETPDFQTKQIIRHKPNLNDKNLAYKSSTYSEAKNPSKTDGKIHKNGNNRKTKPDNVPTVYAHSKVVKYGKVGDENEENATPVVTYYLPDNMQYEEDGKTIVVAKRIPADHFW